MNQILHISIVLHHGAEGRGPLDDERVQTVECADDGQPQGASLGSLRIDKIHTRKIRSVFGRAVHGDSMRGGCGRLDEEDRRSTQGEGGYRLFQGFVNHNGRSVASAVHPPGRTRLYGVAQT